MSFSPSELEIYRRQMMLPGWGEEGQKKLKLAKVVVTGAGGLGSPSAIYLAAAGVGNLVIVDKDRYELSNLNRQILGWKKDVGRLKAEASREKIEAMNPYINVEALAMEIKEENVESVVSDSDVVVDAADNWKTRFMVNDECVKEKIPFVHAGIHGLYGQITTILPREGPCLRCILPKTPTDVATLPVLGATPGLFAALQVMEAVKLITGIGKPLAGKMIFFDGEETSFSEIELTRNPFCPVCGA